MKLTQGILGCALAAGLMTFAINKVQANDVSDNVLLAPLTIKATVTFMINGKSTKKTLDNKVILGILDAPKGAKLVVDTASGDVYGVTKTDSEDLTTDGNLTISNTITSHTVSGIVETDTGTTEIDFYDNPQFDTGLDKAASEADSDNWFEITGTYTLTHSEAAPKNGLSKVSDSFSASGLSGNGYFDEVESDIVPVTSGSVTAKGSGSLVVP